MASLESPLAHSERLTSFTALQSRDLLGKSLELVKVGLLAAFFTAEESLDFGI